MNNYTFNFNERTQSSNATTTTRKATDRQIQYYLDLCTQRKVRPVNYVGLSYDEMNNLIIELRSFYPASEAQIQIIKDKIESLSNLGVKINAPDFSKLTGGRTGTASTLIESLIEMERQYNDVLPPTEAQLQFLVSMYLCPDIPFEENFDIKRRLDLGDGMWRKLTPEEFAEEIKSKMKKRDASAFIDAHRGVFHTWKTTRIRPEQMKYIRQLEERMRDLSTPSAIEWAVDEEGNLIQVTNKVDKSKDYNPIGYVPLEDMELLMFSVEQASQYIDMLKSEQGRKELYRFHEISDCSLTFEDIRKAKTPQEQFKKDLKELQDLMFKLEAIAGYEDEELHHAVSELLLQDEVDFEELRQQKIKIKEFMLSLVENQAASFDGLVELCKNSETAQSILIM